MIDLELHRKKNVLVVGGAGYIGGAVTDILMSKPERYNIRVYDNLLYEESYRKPIEFAFGDILDAERLLPHIQWADAVIWLAGIVGDGACKWDEVLTIKTNQETVAWLKDHFSGRIVFASTCSVYGAQDDPNLIETSPVKPLSLYAYTKLKSEEILRDADAVIFRLGTIFGVSDAFSRIRMDLVVNLLTARAYGSGVINVFGGEQYRPLLHVIDAAHYMVEAIDTPRTPQAEIFNLAHSNMKMIDLAQEIIKHFPGTRIEITDMPFQDTRNYQVLASKAERAFRHRPKYDIDHAVNQLKEILLSRRIKDHNNPRYSNQLFLKDVLKR